MGYMDVRLSGIEENTGDRYINLVTISLITTKLTCIELYLALIVYTASRVLRV